MHIPLLSNITIKKHLSLPGVRQEATALLQELKTHPMRRRGYGGEGYDASQEYIEIADRTVGPHCLAALNGIAQAVGSQNGFKGKVYFISPEGQNTTQLCGPAFNVNGLNMDQLPHFLDACKQWLSKNLPAKQPSVSSP